MKIVVIPDLHGRSDWKIIVSQQEDADMFVFLGDYFDTHEDISPALQMFNFKEVIAFKKVSEIPVILLIGNHDMHYFPEIGYNGTSGYQRIHSLPIGDLLDINRQHLQMAYIEDVYLFSHAGVSYTWLIDQGWDEKTPIDEFVNDVWKYRPKAFNFTPNTSSDYTGDSITQTPVWIRPRHLMIASQNLKKKYIQIVGHTQQRQIDLEGKITGGRYLFVDTMGTSGEYLVINNKKFTLGKIK